MNSKYRTKGVINYSNRALGEGNFKYLGGSAEMYTSGGMAALKELRAKGTRSQISTFRQLSFKNRSGNNSLFRMRYQDPNLIFSGKFFNQVSLENEIEWCRGYIEHHRLAIIDYINVKTIVYSEFEKGNLEIAVDKIVEFFDSNGYSFSFIEMLLYLLNKIGGIEKQKDYRDKFNKRFPKTPLAFYMSAISQRTEDNLLFDNYRSSIILSIKKWDLDEKHANFYKYRLAGVQGFTKDEVSGLLLVHSFVSPFDLYEYLTEIKQDYSESFSKSFINLLQDIEDQANLPNLDFDISKSISSYNLNDEEIRNQLAKELLFLRWSGKSNYWKVYLYITSNITREWIYCHDSLNQSQVNFVLNDSFKMRANVMRLLSIGQNSQAAEQSALLGAEFPEMRELLPLIELNQIIDSKDFSNNVIKSIILDFFNKRYDDYKLRLRQKWYFEDAIEDNGFDKPSEMFSSVDGNSPIYQYFFSEVCIINNLSFLDIFQASREVDTERMYICSNLINLSPDKFGFLKEEVTSIVMKNAVADGIQMVDQSRIYVDVEAIQKWAYINLRDLFRRYIALEKINRENHSLEDISLFDVLDNRPELLRYLEVSNDEAGDILKSIIVSLREKFLFDPEYGLNSFLSMRIRHGTLGGTLKGPVSEYHLLTSKNRDGGDVVNPIILGRLSTSQDTVLITNLLKNFSDGFNKIIDRDIIPLFYVRSHEQPKGMITLTISENMLSPFKLTVVGMVEDDYSIFFGNIITYFKRLVSEELNDISNLLQNSIYDNINSLFAKLLEDLNLINSDFKEDLKNAVMSARQDTNQAINTVISWLTMADDEAIDSFFDFQQAINIALNSAINISRGFHPKIEVEIPSNVVDIGVEMPVVRQFSDIMYIVIDNASKHSGLPDPEISIALALEDETEKTSNLTMTISSRMAGLPTESQIIDLQEIEKSINHDSYKSRLAKEGKTGLIKIKNIVSVNRWHKYDFKYNDDKFEINITFPIRIVDYK